MTLEGLRGQAWRRLARGVADRRSAARHPTLATVALDGGAEARTVVLRAVDVASAMLEFYTDRASAKAVELQRMPRAGLHVWDARVRLQIRLRLLVSPLPEEEALARWRQVPARSRPAYGGDPAPGQPLSHAEDYTDAVDPERFLPLRCQVQAMELLHLGAALQRRALFERRDGFAGRWLAP